MKIIDAKTFGDLKQTYTYLEEVNSIYIAINDENYFLYENKNDKDDEYDNLQFDKIYIDFEIMKIRLIKE